MSAFEELQHQMQKAKDKVRKKVSEAVSMVSEASKKAEYELAIKNKAANMQALLADPRHSDMRDFLLELRQSYSKGLEITAAQDPDPYTSLSVARGYGVKIELIDRILTHPERCIADMKRIEKEAAEQK